MIVQKIPQNLKKKLLEVISEFSKVAGNKINIQKLVVFLHTSNGYSEIEIKNNIYSNIQNMKCLDIKLTKDVQDLFIENYKVLRKMEDLNKWKAIP